MAWKQMPKQVILLGLALIGSGCNIFKEPSDKPIPKGTYQHQSRGKAQESYFKFTNDTLFLFPLEADGMDTSQDPKIYPSRTGQAIDSVPQLATNKFDLDFIVMPVKYRFAKQGIPHQLNAEMVGALFGGFRRDYYQVRYDESPLGQYEREINHWGFSLGFFSGFGNTFMSPTNTGFEIEEEYDGIVWTKGLGTIVSLNNFSVGLVAGFDNLLDKNRDVWIYEEEPYVGAVVGINLN